MFFSFIFQLFIQGTHSRYKTIVRLMNISNNIFSSNIKPIILLQLRILELYVDWQQEHRNGVVLEQLQQDFHFSFKF